MVLKPWIFTFYIPFCKRQFETFLSGQGLLGFVTGSSPPPVLVLNIPSNKWEENNTVPNWAYFRVFFLKFTFIRMGLGPSQLL